MRTRGDVLFYERQYMPKWALVIVLVVGIALPTLLILTKGKDSPPLLIFLFLFLLLIFALFATMQTKVRKDEIEITFGFLPLIKRSYGLHMIQSYVARTYSPVSEYGSWGIKGTKKNRALNMRGEYGVQMEMLDKHKQPWKLLIGSQKPEELVQAIARAKGEQS